MSRIDTTSSAEMYLRGASLGTQQFGILANLAQQRIDNERQAAVDALNVKQLDINNARNVRRDALDTWQTLHGMRMESVRSGIDVAQEKRAAEAFKLELEDRKRKLEGRSQLASVLAGSLREQLRTTRQAQNEAFAEQVMLQGGGKAGSIIGPGLPQGGSGGLVGGLAGGTAGPAAGADAMMPGLAKDRQEQEGTFKAMFRVDPRADPLDQQYETAIALAEATGNVEMLQALSELADDKAKRAAAFRRGVLLQRFPVEMIADPKDQALAKIAIANEDYKLLAQVARSGQLDLNGVTYEQFAKTVSTISGGKATPEVIDALWTTQRMAQSSPSATSSVMEYARNLAGEGRPALDALKLELKRADDELEQARKFKTNLADGRYGASPDQIKAADDAITKAEEKVWKIQNNLNRAAGLPAGDAPKNTATINIGGKDVEVDDDQAVKIGQAAREQFIRIHKREPVEGQDNEEIKAIRDRLMRSTGDVE